jgi:hypothetical protein
MGGQLDIHVLPRRLWVLTPTAGEIRLFTQMDSLQTMASS